MSEHSEAAAPAPGVPAAPIPPGPDPSLEWRRLDTRMLLVHPVQELIRFFPLVIGAFVVGSTGEQNYWQLVGVAIPVALGVLRFLTTRFRITGTQIELQRGLLSRKVLTARLDRVRAVELSSSPIHRLLRLAKVEVGTAASGARQAEDKFALDALALPQARELRAALLHRVDAGGPAEARTDGLDQDVVAAAPIEEQVLLRLDPAWVRYAPLTSSGNVIAAGVLALFGQFGDRLGPDVFARQGVADRLLELSLVVLVPLALVAFLVLGAVFAVLGYFVANWGFTLSRDARGRTFHVRRGLLTNTETSLERERVRGLEVGEPLGLRLAGAGRLTPVVTGLSRSERSSAQLVPPAPRGVVDSVGAEVLGDSDPLYVALRRHGPAARRRRYLRALMGGAVPGLLVAVLCLTTEVTWWALLPALLVLPVAAALAADRYRRLGHALSGGYLVLRGGSLRGRRDVLQRRGIIGWNLQQSWFQRRAGLVTLVATTAAGQQAYAALDIPEGLAIALAEEAAPGLVGEFLVRH